MSQIEVAPYWGRSYHLAHEPGVHRRQPEPEGVNCRAVVHWHFEQRYGLVLPEDQLSLEMFTNTRDLFRVVEPDESPLEGDIYFFGRKRNGHAPKTFHVAVFVGHYETRGDLADPLLLHATRETGRVCLWPLTLFASYPRYAVLYGVRRSRALEDRLIVKTLESPR